jgi:DNA-binding CsgD family transcriptional regulator
VRKSLLTLFIFGLFSVCWGQERLIDAILDKHSEERVNALFNVIDTSQLIRTSPAILNALLAKVEEDAESKSDSRLKKYIRFLRTVGPTFYEEDVSQRIQTYQKGADFFKKAGDKLSEAICLYYLGQENIILGNYGEAFDKSVRSARMLKEIGHANIPEIGRYLHGMSLNYYFFRDYPKVLTILRESLEHPAYNRNLDIQRYNTMALAHRNLGNSDSAAYYFEQTLSRARFYGDSTWIALASGNLGALYAKEGQLDTALPLLQLDYDYNKFDFNTPDMAKNAALAIADVWLKKKRSDSAMHYLEASILLHRRSQAKTSYGDQQRNEEYHRSYYAILSQYHEQKGQFLLAFRYLDSLHRIGQELDRRYNTMVAKREEERLSIQQYVSAIELEREKRETATTRWILALAVLLLCTISIGSLYILNRVKQSRQRVILQLKQNEILAEQQLTMAAFERAKDQLRYQLDLLDEKNGLISRLQKELDELGNEPPPALLEETLRKLGNSRLLTQEDWVSFRRQFNTVFNNSLEELRQEYPDLTQSEERIYALTQLDIDTRQMASMLGISPESVRKAKYRLNKKLKNAS